MFSPLNVVPQGRARRLACAGHARHRAGVDHRLRAGVDRRLRAVRTGPAAGLACGQEDGGPSAGREAQGCGVRSAQAGWTSVVGQ